MPLNDDDINHLKTLSIELGRMHKPKYGNDNWYTIATAGWAPPLARGQLIAKEQATSGEEVGQLPEWAVNATETGARRDAEVHLALRYNDELIKQTGATPKVTPAGTLYIVVDKGPCRSCRNVLKALQAYWNFRMVVFYLGQKTASGRVGQHGFSDAIAHASGHYIIFDIK